VVKEELPEPKATFSKSCRGGNQWGSNEAKSPSLSKRRPDGETAEGGKKNS